MIIITIPIATSDAVIKVSTRFIPNPANYQRRAQHQEEKYSLRAHIAAASGSTFRAWTVAPEDQ